MEDGSPYPSTDGIFGDVLTETLVTKYEQSYQFGKKPWTSVSLAGWEDVLEATGAELVPKPVVQSSDE